MKLMKTLNILLLFIVESLIFSHPFKGSYEHQDENGNWVEGPALGHGYEGGYDYSFNIDVFFGNLIAKLKS